MATKVFVDTNIILDLFDNKRPFHKDSVSLYQCVEDNLIGAFISETVLATTDYILQKIFVEKCEGIAIYRTNSFFSNFALQQYHF